MIIVCPKCEREIELIRFGDGFVGTCCKRVLYNSHSGPEEYPCTETPEESRSASGMNSEFQGVSP